MPTHTEPLTDTKLTDTKLLFGLRTSQQVTLTVVGQPETQAPDLWILSNGQSSYAVITYDRNHGRWTVVLPVGDHIVRMDAPGDSWFAGEVRFTLSAESTIVVCEAKDTWPPVSGIAANAVVNDPKYPSPPLLAARPLAATDWLCRTLQSLYGQLAPSRGADLRSSFHSISPPAQ